MTYMLRDRADGQIEIVHLRPTVVGVIIDRHMAEAFVRFLGRRDGEDGDTITLEPGSPTASAALAEALEKAEVMDVAAARVKANANVIISPLRPAPAETQGAKPVSVADRDAAFACLRAGEKLTDVAERYGMTMGRLRGLWAQSRKTDRPAAEPAWPEYSEDCRLCGKTFVACDVSDGLCARCSR